MPTVFSPDKKARLWRLLILTGILTGLLFSSGEGIRLFPFPPAERTRAASSLFDVAGDADYQKNLFRFEKGETPSCSKQPRAGRDDRAAAAAPPFFSLVFRLRSFPPGSQRAGRLIHPFATARSPLAGRAPPFA